MKPSAPPYRLVWFSAGVLLLALLLLRSPALALGSLPARWVTGSVLCVLALVAFFLLPERAKDGRWNLHLLFPVAAALFLRAFLLDHQTQDYQYFLSVWAAYFRDNGGIAALGQSLGDYNVPYLYFLALISYLDLPDLYLIKLFSILFDVLLAWGGWRLARGLTETAWKPNLVFCLLLLLPTVMLNGAYWGQCDSLYAALCLHALAAALEDEPVPSLLLLALAFSFKLQTIFLLPLWCVLWYGGRVKFRHLLLFPAAFLATALPAMLAGRPLADILGIYLRQTEEYTALTLNAPSVFALLPYGVQVDETLLARLGIALAFALVLALLAFLWFHRATLSDQAILLAGAAMALGVPLLLPHMHDRYYFLADVLTCLLAVLFPRRHLPTALLVQAASLGAYHAYLKLQYAFPMAWGALFNLAALGLLLFHLHQSAAPPGRRLKK